MDQRKLSMALLAGGGLCVVVGATWLVAGGGGDGPTTETASVEDDSSTSTSSTSTTSTSTTTTTTTGPPPDETPQEFLAAFNEAFASDDADFLIERLNQAVFDMFGSDTCIALPDGNRHNRGARDPSARSWRPGTMGLSL